MSERICEGLASGGGQTQERGSLRNSCEVAEARLGSWAWASMARA